MPQWFVLGVTRSLAALPGQCTFLRKMFGCVCVTLGAWATRSRRGITSVHVIAIVHSARLEMLLCWLRGGLMLRRISRSGSPLVSTLGSFYVASDGRARQVVCAFRLPTAVSSPPAALLHHPLRGPWGPPCGGELRTRAARRPTASRDRRRHIVGTRDGIFLARQEGESMLGLRLRLLRKAATLRTSRRASTAVPATWNLRAGYSRLPAWISIGVATCCSSASAWASSQCCRRRGRSREEMKEARSRKTRRGTQEPGRMRSRGGSIATRPMDPEGMGNVVVPELLVASRFA